MAPLSATTADLNIPTRGRLPTRRAPTRGRSPNKKALLIGITYQSGGESPEDLSPIPTSIPNVMKIKAHLEQNWDYTDITVMTDEGGVEPRLQPTRANLEREIRAFVRGVKPGDRRFFYFAGHSDQMVCTTGSEEDGMDEALVDLHGLMIRDNTLSDWLVKDLPKGSALTAIFDCCHSGTLLDLQHYRCNNVYHPWVNKGRRRSKTLCNGMTRRNCRFRSGPLSRPQSRRSSTENVQFNIMQTLEPFPLSPVDEGSNKSSADDGSDKHQGQRCMSPERQFQCEGWCLDPAERKGSLQHADVISISSSNDEQLSWDASTRNGDSISMTSSLTKILQDHPKITYSDLMTRLNHEVYKFTFKMHKHVRNDRRARRRDRKSVSRRNTEPDEERGEMDNFQDLQLGSISPLDMERLVVF